MSLKDWLNLLLKSGADDPELEEGLSLWKRIRNGEEKPSTIATEKPETVKPSSNGHGHSTRRASIIPLQDWMTIENAAVQVGLTPREVERIVKENHLDIRQFNRAAALVSCRQIAYWLEHKTYLEVHQQSLFSDWVRMNDAAALVGCHAAALSKMAAEKKIAYYNPAPKLSLVNLTEVEQVFKARK